MAESHVERVHTEAVVLDIGGSIGALIINAAPEAVGREIEISLRQPHARRVHNQIHERRVHGTTVFAAVYPDLPEGDYDIWRSHDELAGSVRITGGQIAEVDWRSI
jgi:cyclopropane fatty-acyl-phospholipid synthase-like methyltransferase